MTNKIILYGAKNISELKHNFDMKRSNLDEAKQKQKVKEKEG
jgi:hypothetical protein